MDLWSKGLGKRVLSLALSEHESIDIVDDELVIEGVMHAPTYWDYAVTLDRQDITEFLDLLQRPESVRFVFEDENRNHVLKIALTSALAFATQTLRMLVVGPPTSEPATSRTGDFTTEDFTPEDGGGTNGRT